MCEFFCCTLFVFGFGMNMIFVLGSFLCLVLCAGVRAVFVLGCGWFIFLFFGVCFLGFFLEVFEPLLFFDVVFIC